MNVSQLFVGAAAAMAGVRGFPGAAQGSGTSSSGVVPAGVRNGDLDLAGVMLQLEQQVFDCWDRTALRAIPTPRKAALCIAGAAALQCEGSTDRWCREALRRTVAGGKRAVVKTPGDPLAAQSPAANHRALNGLLSRAGPEFKASNVFQEGMMALEIEFGDLTSFDTTQPGLVVTTRDLVQILTDSDSGSGSDEVAGSQQAGSARSPLGRFESALKAQGWVLHQGLRRIAREHIQAEPEHYAEALYDRLDRWLDRQFPKDDDIALGNHRRHYLLGLLVDHITARAA